MESIGIIGGGNMGEALVSGILKNRLVPKNRLSVGEAMVSQRKRLRARYGIFVTGQNGRVVSRSSVLVLAVKPQQMEEVLTEIAPLPRNKLVISIAAGVRLSRLERHLGKLPMVRVMPNLAASVGEAISALAKNRSCSRRQSVVAARLFSSVGETVWVEESKLDAITALSGSGPAYVAFFIQALREGATLIGLPKKLSLRLIQKTFQGSVAYLLKKGIDPERFIKKVASKGGTTEAALKVFHSRRLSQTITLALRRAAARSQQLSKG